MRFHHFILTNFNVQMPDHPVDRNGVPVLTRGWLDQRVHLFETLCLPSVAGQTCTSFEWLIRFGAETPEDLKQRVGRWQASANITPLWDELPPRRAIRARVPDASSVIVTTRLDNDDLLHRDFVAVIQSEVRGDTEVLCPALGYVLSYPAGDLRCVTEPTSPFSTLVDHVQGAPTRTIRQVDHRRVAALAPVRNLADERLWLRLVHDRNASNVFRGDSPCDTVGVREAFNIAPDVVIRADRTPEEPAEAVS